MFNGSILWPRREFWVGPADTFYSHQLMLYGNVDVRQVDLGFRVFGRLQEIHFEEGDLVKSGQILARLDPQPYEDKKREAKAQVEAITGNLTNAEKVLIRRQELIKSGDVSQETYEGALASPDVLRGNLNQALAELASAETNLKDTVLIASTEGTLLSRIREPGAIVREGVTVR